MTSDNARLILKPLTPAYSCDFREIYLDEPCKIGRAVGKIKPLKNNSIFDCKVLSRNHAVIWYENGKFFLKDTKSSNGTFANKQRLSEGGEESIPFEIFSNDELQFGVDVIDNQVVHPCIISQVILFHPDGREALSNCNNLSLRDIHRLEQVMHEVKMKESILSQKQQDFNDIINEIMDFTNDSWKAMIDEDSLLTRIKLLENELEVYKKPMDDNELKNNLLMFNMAKFEEEGLLKSKLILLYRDKSDVESTVDTLKYSLREREIVNERLAISLSEAHKQLDMLHDTKYFLQEELSNIQNQFQQMEQHYKEVLDELQRNQLVLPPDSVSENGHLIPPPPPPDPEEDQNLIIDAKTSSEISPLHVENGQLVEDIIKDTTADTALPLKQPLVNGFPEDGGLVIGDLSHAEIESHLNSIDEVLEKYNDIPFENHPLLTDFSDDNDSDISDSTFRAPHDSLNDENFMSDISFDFKVNGKRDQSNYLSGSQGNKNLTKDDHGSQHLDNDGGLRNAKIEEHSEFVTVSFLNAQIKKTNENLRHNINNNNNNLKCISSAFKSSESPSTLPGKHLLHYAAPTIPTGIITKSAFHSPRPSHTFLAQKMLSFDEHYSFDLRHRMDKFKEFFDAQLVVLNDTCFGKMHFLSARISVCLNKLAESEDLVKCKATKYGETFKAHQNQIKNLEEDLKNLQGDLSREKMAHERTVSEKENLDRLLKERLRALRQATDEIKTFKAKLLEYETHNAKLKGENEVFTRKHELFKSSASYKDYDGLSLLVDQDETCNDACDNLLNKINPEFEELVETTTKRDDDYEELFYQTKMGIDACLSPSISNKISSLIPPNQLTIYLNRVSMFLNNLLYGIMPVDPSIFSWNIYIVSISVLVLTIIAFLVFRD